MSKKVKRLFEGFHPTHYTIDIDPDRESMKLTGTVTVTGKKVGRPSQRLTFHQNGLKVTEASIVRHDKRGDQTFAVTRINSQDSFDEVRLHVEEQLFPGDYEVTMRYEGEITRPMDGVYPCFFKQGDQEKKLIATQFESHFARQAFPCIDEPEAKATFDLTLASPVGETVISNTPIKEQTEQDGKLRTTFETTPKMSTYLLAFVYGELDYKEATTKSGVTVRTYATADNVQFTDFALDVAVKCLDFYEEYFDIPYPLAKCDLIALPDFASGAMENWGCITFREHGMLLDPANTSLSTKQYIAMVVSHELSHQWFGNLVTMRWWTDLWLNEGFANWMEYFAIAELFPEWQMWTQYIVDEQQIALKLDALENTHPIQTAINHPDEIRTIFDTISYSKGGSSIQMLAHYLGRDAFRDGLRHYLKQHAHGNTDTVDLWDALEIVSKKPVKDFMQAWTSNTGFPLLRVNIDGENVSLQQEQFLVNPLVRTEAGVETLWPIALRAGENAPEVLDGREKQFTYTSSDILKFNREQSGFYRTVYNPEHVEKLAALVRSGELSPLDRLGVLSDTFEAAKAGYTDTISALTLMEAYAKEDNSAVWDVMVGNLASIRAVMNDDDLRELIKPYGRKLVAEQLARLGWKAKDDDTHFDKLLRPTIIGLATVSGEPKVVEEALRQFNEMTQAEEIAPDLRGIVYTNAARHGDEKTFERLVAMHNASSMSEERITLAAAITDFEQPELIKRALDMITTDDVRLQDVVYWIAYSFSNRYAREATWDWMVANWQWLKDNLGSDLSFYRMPIYAARACSDADFLEEFKQFFEGVMEPALERSVKQAVEMIEWQSEWKKRDFEAIKTFFAA
jgi:aminopeptidase N